MAVILRAARWLGVVLLAVNTIVMVAAAPGTHFLSLPLALIGAGLAVWLARFGDDEPWPGPVATTLLGVGTVGMVFVLALLLGA